MARRSPDSGAKLLAAFLLRNGISYRNAGKALHVSGTIVWQWTHDEKTPTPTRRADIETWTRGDVPAASWGPVELPQVVPFDATGTDPHTG